MKYKVFYHTYYKSFFYPGVNRFWKNYKYIVKAISPNKALIEFDKRKCVDYDNIVIDRIYDIINKRSYSLCQLLNKNN